MYILISIMYMYMYTYTSPVFFNLKNPLRSLLIRIFNKDIKILDIFNSGTSEWIVDICSMYILTRFTPSFCTLPRNREFSMVVTLLDVHEAIGMKIV